MKPNNCYWCGNETGCVGCELKHGREIYIRCRNTACDAMGPTCKTEEEAVEEWNSIAEEWNSIASPTEDPPKQSADDAQRERFVLATLSGFAALASGMKLNADYYLATADKLLAEMRKLK